MARPLRVEYPGAVYHITSRGNARNRIFNDDQDKTRFLEVLESVVKKVSWFCHGYCLMDNHYHLLVETPEGNLSSGMRQLNGVYTQRYNKRHDKTGHIFEGRYKSVLVEKESYLLELCRYIILNPIRAGIVDDPAKWKWSSFPATIGKVDKPKYLSIDWILGQFGSKTSIARKKYIYFIFDGINKTPQEKISTKAILGSESFINQFKGLLKDKEAIKEIPRNQRYLTRPSLTSLFTNPKQLNKSKRNKTMTKAHLIYGYTLKEIADHLGIHYTTVSKAIEKLE